MNIEALKNIKIAARQMQKDLHETHGKISLHTVFHTLSKQYGFKDWNHASAYAKRNNIQITVYKHDHKG